MAEPPKEKTFGMLGFSIFWEVVVPLRSAGMFEVTLR
jgi:hypothetical protein